MDNVNEIKEQLSYITKLLESLVDAVDASRYKARKKVHGFKDVAKMMSNNPIFQSSPEAASIITNVMDSLQALAEDEEEGQT